MIESIRLNNVNKTNGSTLVSYFHSPDASSEAVVRTPFIIDAHISSAAPLR